MNLLYTLFLMALSATPFLPTITAIRNKDLLPPKSNKDFLSSQTSFLHLLHKSAIPPYSETTFISTNMAYSPYGVDAMIAPLQHVITLEGKYALNNVYQVLLVEPSFGVIYIETKEEAGVTFTCDFAFVMRLNETHQHNLRGHSTSTHAIKMLDNLKTVGYLTPSEYDLLHMLHVMGMKRYFLKLGEERKVEQAVNTLISSTTNGMVQGNEKFRDTTTRFSVISSVYFTAKWKYTMTLQYGTFFTVDDYMKPIYYDNVKYAVHFGEYFRATLFHSKVHQVNILSVPFDDTRFSMNFIYPTGDIPAFLESVVQNKMDVKKIKKGPHFKRRNGLLLIKFPVFKLESKIPLQHALEQHSINYVISASLNVVLGNNPNKIHFGQKSAIRIDEAGVMAANPESAAEPKTNRYARAEVTTVFMFQIEYNCNGNSVILYQGIINDILDAQKDM